MATTDRSEGFNAVGVIPLLVLQIIGITLIWLFPAVATTLPTLLFGS